MLQAASHSGNCRNDAQQPQRWPCHLLMACVRAAMQLRWLSWGPCSETRCFSWGHRITLQSFLHFSNKTVCWWVGICSCNDGYHNGFSDTILPKVRAPCWNHWASERLWNENQFRRQDQSIEPVPLPNFVAVCATLLRHSHRFIDGHSCHSSF